jgi:hypothetical protein
MSTHTVQTFGSCMCDVPDRFYVISLQLTIIYFLHSPCKYFSFSLNCLNRHQAYSLFKDQLQAGELLGWGGLMVQPLWTEELKGRQNKYCK